MEFLAKIVKAWKQKSSTADFWQGSECVLESFITFWSGSFLHSIDCNRSALPNTHTTRKSEFHFAVNYYESRLKVFFFTNTKINYVILFLNWHIAENFQHKSILTTL